MSILQALGPVQTWLGQELEKCGIDAVIYTRYILSLLLQDTFEVEPQEQEGNICVPWDKGPGRRLGKNKKKWTSGLSLEEMKKQAAVQCLRSASEETSGIEMLVEELCCKLKDLQDQQKDGQSFGKLTPKKGSPSLDDGPTSNKDEAEMYYEAFPALSEKTAPFPATSTSVWVCKAKMLRGTSSSTSDSVSSSSTLQQACTETSSPVELCSDDDETVRERPSGKPESGSSPGQRDSGKENEHDRSIFKRHKAKPSFSRRQGRVRLSGEGKLLRTHSGSSDSSDAGSASGSNRPFEVNTLRKALRLKQRIRETDRVPRLQEAMVKPSRKYSKKFDKSKYVGGGTARYESYSRGGFAEKERGKSNDLELTSEENLFGQTRRQGLQEEPMWYTEPLGVCFVSQNQKSKLETSYRGLASSQAENSELHPQAKRSEEVHPPHYSKNAYDDVFRSAGTFIDGCFVEVPVVSSDGAEREMPTTELKNNIRTELNCLDCDYFREVNFYQSMLDPSASELLPNSSRILKLIHQNSTEHVSVESENHVGSFETQSKESESAIWTDEQVLEKPEILNLRDSQDGNNSINKLSPTVARFWDCSSPSFCSEDEGSQDDHLVSFFNSPIFHIDERFGCLVIKSKECPQIEQLNSDKDKFPKPEPSLDMAALFPEVDVQFTNQPQGPLEVFVDTVSEKLGSALWEDAGAAKTSRLAMWTRSQTCEDDGPFSSLSTRTGSPWSHSDDVRSEDAASFNLQGDDLSKFPAEEKNVSSLTDSVTMQESDLLNLIPQHNQFDVDGALRKLPPLSCKHGSKLAAVCGIQLEEDREEIPLVNETIYLSSPLSAFPHQSSSGNPIQFLNETSHDVLPPPNLSHSASVTNHTFTVEVTTPPCNVEGKKCLPKMASTAVQRSEYRLWDNVNSNASVMAEGTSEKVWDMTEETDTSFILGGVYGTGKHLKDECSSMQNWASVLSTEQKDSSLLESASPNAVIIAGPNLCMAPNFHAQHKSLWKSRFPFAQGGLSVKWEERMDATIPFLLQDDCGGSYSNYLGSDFCHSPGIKCTFPSLDLNSHFSHLLSVQCAVQPDVDSPLDAPFKPKPVLSSGTEAHNLEHHKVYGLCQMQYRAIRISPRTHFRPIQAGELSPFAGDTSDSESEKGDETLPIVTYSDLFEQPEADLRPLEEDAVANYQEYKCYAQSETDTQHMEVPQVRKTAIERGAQTSLDSQDKLTVACGDDCVQECASESSSAPHVIGCFGSNAKHDANKDIEQQSTGGERGTDECYGSFILGGVYSTSDEQERYAKPFIACKNCWSDDETKEQEDDCWNLLDSISRLTIRCSKPPESCEKGDSSWINKQLGNIQTSQASEVDCGIQCATFQPDVSAVVVGRHTFPGRLGSFFIGDPDLSDSSDDAESDGSQDDDTTFSEKDEPI